MCRTPHPPELNSECASVSTEDKNTDFDCSHEHPDDDMDGDLAPSVDTPPPSEIETLCGLCIDYVQRALGIPLDFSAETLPILDHYLLLARESIAIRPELSLLITEAVGAYFGELVRRRLNGHWLIPNADVHNWRICARTVFLSLNPIGVVCEALAQRDEHEGPSGQLLLAPEDRASVAQRLARVPEVPSGQYYLLSTRLEAIDIAVETLRLAMEQGGQAALEFELQDYEFT